MWLSFSRGTCSAEFDVQVQTRPQPARKYRDNLVGLLTGLMLARDEIHGIDIVLCVNS